MERKGATYLNNNTATERAKFEPRNGNILFFVGQDMGATGGLENYSNGYADHFEVPAGFTVYTNLSPEEYVFGLNQKGIDGIKTKSNWGAGDSCAQCYIDSENYNNSVMAIGLSMVNHENKIAEGEHDELIIELGEWIKSTRRPVFLRIGYEFDGWDWNHYEKEAYLAAWKRIHSMYEEMNIDNIAYVWQSKGTGSGQEILEEWYPGDDLVDWCGYSYFSRPDEEMLAFARRHNKPVFIAEASPVLQDGDSFANTDLSDPEVAKEAWETWFIPFIRTLNENKDVVKAFSYINVDWKSQPMWIDNPVFQQVDSRIQKSEFISRKWEKEISKPRYLKPTPSLWDSLIINQ